MKRSGTFVLVIALLAVLALTGLPSAAAEEVKGTGYRGSYFMNGEIHVNEYGTPEGKPLTSGTPGLQAVLVEDRRHARLLPPIEERSGRDQLEDRDPHHQR